MLTQPCIDKERLKHLKDHLYSFTCAQTTKFNIGSKILNCRYPTGGRFPERVYSELNGDATETTDGAGGGK